jgi:type I restriction enzyme S subunit
MTADAAWPQAKVGDLIIDLQPGFACGAHNSNGAGVPHFRPMNVSTEGRIDRSVLKFVGLEFANRPQQRLRHGDVLFNNTNSPELVGKTALFTDDDEPAFSNHMTRLRPDPTRVEPEFLALMLHQVWRSGWFAVHCNNHVSQASIGRAVLEALEIPLPPLDIQRSIGALNARVSGSRRGAVRHLSSASLALDRFRQSVLAAACSGRLTADWRADNPTQSATALLAELAVTQSANNDRYRAAKAVEPSMTDLREDDLPASWAIAPLHQLIEPGRPITYGILKPGLHLEGGVPYVRVTDFKTGTVSLVNIRRTSELIATGYRRSVLRAGDLLFAIRGTFGHIAFVPPQLDGGNITQDTARLALDPRVSREYVALALRSPTVQRRIADAAKGVTVRGVNLGDLRELLLPLPPRPEQDEIVRRVHNFLAAADTIKDRMDQVTHAVERSAQKLAAASFQRPSASRFRSTSVPTILLKPASAAEVEQ